MKNKPAMDWHTFSYLNGSRRIIDQMTKQLEEISDAYNHLGIAVAKGDLEKALQHNIAELAKLSGLIMKRVQHERQKDISLYLEDL
jgi:hypothetical protein